MRVNLFWRLCLVFLFLSLVIQFGARSDVPRALWLVSAAAVLLAAGMAWGAARGTSRRLRELREFSQRLAGGDFRPLASLRARSLNHAATSKLDSTAGDAIPHPDSQQGGD